MEYPACEFSLFARFAVVADRAGMPLVLISTGIANIKVPGTVYSYRTQLVVPSLSGASHRVMSLEDAIPWLAAIKLKLHETSRVLGVPIADAPSRNKGKLRTAFVAGNALDVTQYIPVCDASEDWVLEDVGYLMACEAFCQFMADFWGGRGPKRMDPELKALASREDITYEVKTGGLEATLRHTEHTTSDIYMDPSIPEEARRTLLSFLGFTLGSQWGSERGQSETSYEGSDSDY